MRALAPPVPVGAETGRAGRVAGEKAERTRERRRALVEAVRAGECRTQEDLVDRLRKAGHEATQSAVSRDIRALGVAKAEGRYVLPEAIVPGLGSGARAHDPDSPAGIRTPPHRPPPAREAGRGLAQFVLGAAPAGVHLVVVRTSPATAHAVASSIDHGGRPDVLGTVAGDDTVFVAVRDAASQRAFLRWLGDTFQISVPASPSRPARRD